MACPLEALIVRALAKEGLISAGAAPVALRLAEGEIEAHRAIGRTSADLAALIIDAMYMADAVPENAFAHAVSVAAREIDAHKATGEY